MGKDNTYQVKGKRYKVKSDKVDNRGFTEQFHVKGERVYISVVVSKI